MRLTYGYHVWPVIGISLIILMLSVYAYGQDGKGFGDKDFTFNGEPLHPVMIRSLSGLLAGDWKPVMLSIDLAAAYQASEDFEGDVYEDGGYVRYRDEQGTKPFHYRWVGVTPGGIHIVEAGEVIPGADAYMRVLLLRQGTEYSISPDGTPYEQSVLRLVRVYPIGARKDYTVIATERGALIRLPDKEVLIDDVPRPKDDGGPTPKGDVLNVF